MSKTDEIQEITPDDVAELSRLACPDWLAIVPLADDDELMTRIVGNILSADTMEEALSDQGMETASFKDMAGDTVTIHDVRRRPSDTESELGWYALMACTKAGSDEQFVATCGATNVLAQVVWLLGHDKLPAEVNIYSTPSKTNAKRSILRLRTPGSF